MKRIAFYLVFCLAELCKLTFADVFKMYISVKAIVIDKLLSFYVFKYSFEIDLAQLGYVFSVHRAFMRGCKRESRICGDKLSLLVYDGVRYLELIFKAIYYAFCLCLGSVRFKSVQIKLVLNDKVYGE